MYLYTYTADTVCKHMYSKHYKCKYMYISNDVHGPRPIQAANPCYLDPLLDGAFE